MDLSLSESFALLANPMVRYFCKTLAVVLSENLIFFDYLIAVCSTPKTDFSCVEIYFCVITIFLYVTGTVDAVSPYCLRLLYVEIRSFCFFFFHILDF